jgi:hypothetical protein
MTVVGARGVPDEERAQLPHLLPNAGKNERATENFSPLLSSFTLEPAA